MLFNKQDYEYLYNSVTKKFLAYSFINNDYIIELLNALQCNGSFENLFIDVDALSKDMNPLFYISYKIQNYLHFKICQMSINDIDVLLTLVEDKKRVASLVLRKLKIDDMSSIDDYIMNAANVYNGEESFDTFLTRFVMASVRGTDFEVSKKTVSSAESVQNVSEPTKIKKKKNKKNKKKSENILVEQKEISFYDQVINKCRSIMGTAIKDNFVNMVLISDIINDVSMIDDDLYKLYILMRFGLLNDSYYTKEEIASILNVDILKIIQFEREVLKKLKVYLNTSLSNYEKIILFK